MFDSDHWSGFLPFISTWLQKLSMISSRSQVFRTSGGILSGPAHFPSFRDLLACKYSSMVKGPSSMSRFAIMSGMSSSGSSTGGAIPSRFLKWENQVFVRSFGLFPATWPRKGFFFRSLISFITPQTSLYCLLKLKSNINYMFKKAMQITCLKRLFKLHV